MNGELQEPEGAAAPGGARMILSLAGVAAISGILIVTVFQLTLPTIKANKARALRESVFEVLPGAARVVTFKLEADGTVSTHPDEEGKAVHFYAGYGKDDGLIGVAVEARGQGFQDVIKVIYGYAPQKESVVGMRVLESRETPGLGDKIGNDPAFLANFSDLDVRLAEENGPLLHAIEVVKQGKRKERWQIDSITGATISSKAVGKMMNQSANQRVPEIRRNLRRFEEGR